VHVGSRTFSWPKARTTAALVQAIHDAVDAKGTFKFEVVVDPDDGAVGDHGVP
jgi:hypothetical protein